MRKYVAFLFMLLSWCAKGQDYNSSCLACAEINGFYCGDDESNWTQYSPLGCVQGGWINDGWEDCVDASDENNAVPTTVADCQLEVVSCDTVYVDVPIIEYVNVYDTIVEIQVWEEIDTLYIYEDVLDTLFIEVIETIWETEYIDCDTGLPCNTQIVEIIKESKDSNLLYNLQGKVIRKPHSVYIQNGKVKWQK